MASEWDSVLEAALAQGWRKEKSRKGYMLYPPDLSKRPVAVHRTPSDRRALKNHIAEMRRQGFIWPWTEPRRQGREG